MEEALRNAEAAVAHAQQVRSFHRRQTARGSTQRTEDIKLALERIRDAMQPIRSEIGRFPYGPQTTVAEEERARIRAASLALQAERRKLWKMLPKEERNAS